ncbi:MAG: alpha/beta fold hydrolase [Alcanivoracaceae bacterium]|jgi:polyhydroxyalkanoate synthase|nr:alpha/beta fold hydrolase [Alcanivoracaceae bacterium]
MASRPVRLLKSSLRAASHAFERRRHPHRFILTDKTPWVEIFRDGIMAVRHYSLPPMDSINVDGHALPVSHDKKRVPILLVPALGIQAWTFDIMPNRSMVRYLMARGYDVYLLDWGQPSRSDRELTLDTYVNHWLTEAVESVRQHADCAEISLVGYCMGGLLCLMYLGGHPEAPVRNLATIASPVNFHKSGAYGKAFSLLSAPAIKAHNWFRIRLEPLDTRMFHIPGNLLSIGFKMTNPPAMVTSYLDLVRNINDREYITEHMTMGQWFNDMVDYPGATVREVIEKMVIGNSMAGGQIEIGSRKAKLGDVRCDLLALAGATDRIVTISAARDILRLVGSREKRFEVVPGGHAGVFAGSKAPDHTWRIIADWLAQRSD